MKKIADQGGGKYDTAIYAVQCSNLKLLFPICTDWESACWVMVKSWLDVQIDLELERSQPNCLKSNRNDIDESLVQVDGGLTAFSWCKMLVTSCSDATAPRSFCSSRETPFRVCNICQLFARAHPIDIPHLVDLLWAWISPSEDAQKIFRPHGDSQMIRFGAHLVLVLRYLVADQIKDTFREKLMTVGDLILHMDAMFLFSQNHEELVGVYASQLASHLCIDLFVHMMELRLNGSVHIKYKIFLSAMEYLPFSFEDESRGNFIEIIDRVLSRSREIKPGNYDDESLDREYYSCDATYRHWLKINTENEDGSHDLSWDERQREIGAAKETLSSSLSLLKRNERPWLVYLEDTTNESDEPLYLELHATAMVCLHSGECRRPDATSCTTLANALYSSVSEEVVLSRKLMVDVSVSAMDTYCIEVVLRCLAVEGDGLERYESNDGGIAATIMAAGFKEAGELIQFQSGVTMEISRLDAWYSSKDGLLEGPAAYIMLGLCRRCCLPELVIRCMQVNF
ncbi:hypothetical protein GIB67_032860 [Kingdonia uniflora]|uniref:Nuclear pore complex protein n=1 Tax=Kingdonia uniflora TaxID=39325 RepID=A0A7J7NCD0_9MAGN|nr:hypothetical protein GIB67_032860 [Kingdonia uniflora]